MTALQQEAQPNPRRRNVRNGTILALTQTARLVNFPLTQEVGAHVHRLIVGLKLEALQAPKYNDMSMQTLAEQVGDPMDMLEEAQEEMKDRAIVDVRREAAKCRKLFTKLYE